MLPARVFAMSYAQPCSSPTRETNKPPCIAYSLDFEPLSYMGSALRDAVRPAGTSCNHTEHMIAIKSCMRSFLLAEEG